MKCCECGKEVDASKTGIPSPWYGKYEGDKFVDLICAECISEPEKLKRWRNESGDVAKEVHASKS